jgi:GMP synthase-like glutamine amidotransferase
VRVHFLQHVPFEGLGSIRYWLDSRAATITSTKLYQEPRFPDLTDVDWLIAMGGPMSVNDEHTYPWLIQEKQFIRRAIDAGKVVLGVCLGAQLVASSLGARVYPNREREIGWFNIYKLEGDTGGMGALLPSSLEVFHWHGETFDLPAGAVHLARSDACAHQAFSIGDRVLALQFHLETTLESAQALVDNSRGDLLSGGPWVQSEDEMLWDPARFDRINQVITLLLRYFEGR